MGLKLILINSKVGLFIPSLSNWFLNIKDFNGCPRTSTSYRALISVEESEDLTTDMVISSLNMVHDTLICGKDDETELSGWEDLINELLEILQFQVESWWDNGAFVESSVKINDDLSGSLVIDDFEVVDITVLSRLISRP